MLQTLAANHLNSIYYSNGTIYSNVGIIGEDAAGAIVATLAKVLTAGNYTGELSCTSCIPTPLPFCVSGITVCDFIMS